MTRPLALAAMSTCLSAGLRCEATARDAVHWVGRGGWDVERFGGEVTILRNRLSGSGTEEVGLLLSCAGPERRLRLTLPGAVGPDRTRATAGLVLMRSAGAAVISRMTVQGTALVLADRRVVDAVLAELRASSAARRGLDLLLHLGSRPIVLGRLTPLHLSLSSEAGDGSAFQDVSRACGDAASPRPEPASPR